MSEELHELHDILGWQILLWERSQAPQNTVAPPDELCLSFQRINHFSLSYFHLSPSHFIIFYSDSSDLNRQIDLKFVQAFSYSVIICILRLFIWALSNFLMWQLRPINSPQDYFYWFYTIGFDVLCFNFLFSLRFF